MFYILGDGIGPKTLVETFIDDEQGLKDWLSSELWRMLLEELPLGLCVHQSNPCAVVAGCHNPECVLPIGRVERPQARTDS